MIFVWMRRPVGRSRYVDAVMVHLAKKGPLWFFLVLGLIALFGGTPERVAVLEAVAAATLTRGANEVLGRLFFRERPFVQDRLQSLIEHRPDSSFPSNHAACGFALAVAIWLHLPPVGSIMLVMALVLAYSRLYVGVHYPFDVLVGSFIGTLIAKATVVFSAGLQNYLKF